MQKLIEFLAVLGLIALAACSSEEPADAPAATADETADAIYINASAWTGLEGAPRAEAIAVKGGAIQAVGSRADVEAHLGPETRVVDLGGNLVLPGFIDNHTHFLQGGFLLAQISLRDAATPEEFARRIGEYAAGLEAGQWVLGGDWDHELWGGELPRRDWIDEVTPENPVFITRLDGHMSLANSLALELAGVDADTPDPAGGLIVRDESGAPAGVLKDTAQGLVERVIPPPSEADLDAAFDRAAAHALSRGVTQIHDVNNWQSFETFLRARDRGVLNLRVYSMIQLSNWARMADYVADHGGGDDWLRWGGLKGYVDGSLGSTTAWFHEPYSDAPDNSGLTVSDLDDMYGWIHDADAAGLHIAIHAIGDRANDWLLDAYERVAEENGTRDRRFRIEHAQHLSPDAIPRFAALGVIPSMQPYHAIDDGRWAEKRIGPERIKTTYAFRSLLDAGARLTFGSDWTVAPIDPILGIYAAVTRRTIDGANPDGWVPEQKISVAEAVHAYTAANAYAGFQEDCLGTLEAGKLADFVVLSADIFAIPPEDIESTRVLRTVVGGEDRFIAGDTP